MSEMPDNCTLCGKPYTKNAKGQRVIFPYPPNHYLCYPCFTESIDSGIGRLNKELATGNLDLSVEEIADIIKPKSIQSDNLRKETK